MSASHSPLSAHDAREVFPASMEQELQLARECIDKSATANIHDHHEMIRVAITLDHRLRTLVAAIERDRGESA